MADTTTQIEVLKIARDLLMDEYIETVNQLEQRWMFESKMNWMTKQIPTPYPDLPAPPSVDDILAKAQMLMDFFGGTPTPATWYPEPTPMPAPPPEPTPAPEPTPNPMPTQEPQTEPTPLIESNVQ